MISVYYMRCSSRQKYVTEGKYIMVPEYGISPDRQTPAARLAREMMILDQHIETFVERIMGTDAYRSARQQRSAQDAPASPQDAVQYLDEVTNEPGVNLGDMSLLELQFGYDLSRGDPTAQVNLAQYEELKRNYTMTVTDLFNDELPDFDIYNVAEGICTLSKPYTDYTDVRVSFRRTTKSMVVTVFLSHRHQDDSSPLGIGIRFETLDPDEYLDYGVDVQGLLRTAIATYRTINEQLAR